MKILVMLCRAEGYRIVTIKHGRDLDSPLPVITLVVTIK